MKNFSSNISIDAMNSMLLQQHKELCLMFNNIITTLQNMCPWLSSTYRLWEEPLEIGNIISTDSLMVIFVNSFIIFILLKFTN